MKCATWMLVLAFTVGIGITWSSSAEASPFAYVPNNGSDTVSVIDTATNTVIATVPVDRAPFGVAVHPSGRFAYIGNGADEDTVNAKTISVIDTTSNTVAARIVLGPPGRWAPKGLAVHPAGTFLYVGIAAFQDSGVIPHVAVIDIPTNSVVATVPLGLTPATQGGSGPVGIAVSPTGDRVYATGSDVVKVIDTASNTVTATIGLGATPGAHCTAFSGTCPHGIAVHPSGRFVYVARITGPGTGVGGQIPNMAGILSVIDTATNTETMTVQVGFDAFGVAVHPSGSFVYVTNAGSDTVSVVRTADHAVVTNIPVGDAPVGIAMHPSGAFVYVANAGSNNVSVIDSAANAVVATIPVGVAPHALGQFVGSRVVLNVAIDIKPGSDPNSINLSSAGSIPVAILSSATFDATQVDPVTVALAGAAVKLIGKGDRYACSPEDVNGDGLLDFVCHVVTAQFMIEPGDSIAVLEANTFDGTPIRGEDSIQIVPD